MAVKDSEEAARNIFLNHLKGTEGVLVDVFLSLTYDLPRVDVLHLVLRFASIFFAATVLVLLVFLRPLLVFLAAAQIPAK
jgi:hypothetical protein